MQGTERLVCVSVVYSWTDSNPPPPALGSPLQKSPNSPEKIYFWGLKALQQEGRASKGTFLGPTAWQFLTRTAAIQGIVAT